MKNFLSLLFIFYSSFCFSQPVIEWQENLGGSNGELPFSIDQTADSGFIVVGDSGSDDFDVSGNHGSSDIWLVKLDAAGVITWQKCLGGSYIEHAEDVYQTPDHGYIITASVWSTDGDIGFHYGLEYNSDFWVVKTDSLGNLVWEKTYGGSMDDFLRAFEPTTDGGYMIGGESRSDDFDVSEHYGVAGLTSDFWVVKIDSAGNIEWEHAIGGMEGDECLDIIEASDGSYMALGFTASVDGDVLTNHGGTDFWLVQFSAEGEIIWQKTYGGSDSDYPCSIHETGDGGFIMAGKTISTDGDVTSNHGIFDFWAVKIDTSGDILWQQCYGGSRSEEAFDMHITNDNGFIFCGTSASSDGDVSVHYGSIYYPDIWVMRTDVSGVMEWQKTFGGSDIENDPAITVLSDSVFVFAASTTSTDFDITSFYGNPDYWVVKFKFIEASTQISNEKKSLMTVYPNPAVDEIQIDLNEFVSGELFIYNLLGEIVGREEIYSANIHLDISGLEPGQYFIRINNPEESYTATFTKIDHN